MEVSLLQEIVKCTKVQNIGLEENMVHVNPASFFFFHLFCEKQYVKLMG